MLVKKMIGFDSGFMDHRKYLVFVCMAMVLAGAASFAQGQATTAPATQTAPVPTTPGQTAPVQPVPQNAAVPVIKMQSNEVDLVFTVTDKNGKFVTGLNQSSFGLLDDHKQPEAVFRFYQQTNLPLRVGIMLDTSSSIRQRFKFEQDAASTFLLQLLHRNDRAFVEGFDVQTDMEQGFSNNIDLLSQGIRRLRPGGGTSLYDALYSACRDQMLTLREDGPVRRVIVLVTDGDDNFSHALEEDAIKECQRADTIVYAISTDVSPTKDKGDEVLRKIAETTGGQAFYPKRIEDVALGFISIEEELRSQYLLEYRPADFKQDGSFRTIYLHANDPRYHVRAHTGYFAPKAAE
jgi:VWFA-related protein